MKDQILKSTGAELSRLAGEVLQPEKNKHDFRRYGKGGMRWCVKDRGILFGAKKNISCIPDPIPLTWPEAMKWRDWATCEIRESVADKAFAEIAELENKCFVTTKKLNVEWWWLWNAQPEHYIKAACLCKLGTQSRERIE